MTDEEQQPARESIGLGTVISATVVAVALVAFIVQNRGDAKVSWLWLDGTWPLWIVIVVSAVAGAVLSEVFGWLLRRHRSRG